MMVKRGNSPARTVEITKPEQNVLRRHIMKKLLAMLLALCMVFALCACGRPLHPLPTRTCSGLTPLPRRNPPPNPSTSRSGPTRSAAGAMLTPSMPSLPRSRRRTPGITVTVEYLDYTNGDDQVNTALEAAPLPTSSWKGRNVSLPTGVRRATWSISPTWGRHRQVRSQSGLRLGLLHRGRRLL